MASIPHRDSHEQRKVKSATPVKKFNRANSIIFDGENNVSAEQEQVSVADLDLIRKQRWEESERRFLEECEALPNQIMSESAAAFSGVNDESTQKNVDGNSILAPRVRPLLAPRKVDCHGNDQVNLTPRASRPTAPMLCLRPLSLPQEVDIPEEPLIIQSQLMNDDKLVEEFGGSPDSGRFVLKFPQKDEDFHRQSEGRLQEKDNSSSIQEHIKSNRIGYVARDLDDDFKHFFNNFAIREERRNGEESDIEVHIIDDGIEKYRLGSNLEKQGESSDGLRNKFSSQEPPPSNDENMKNNKVMLKPKLRMEPLAYTDNEDKRLDQIDHQVFKKERKNSCSSTSSTSTSSDEEDYLETISRKHIYFPRIRPCRSQDALSVNLETGKSLQLKRSLSSEPCLEHLGTCFDENPLRRKQEEAKIDCHRKRHMSPFPRGGNDLNQDQIFALPKRACLHIRDSAEEVINANSETICNDSRLNNNVDIISSHKQHGSCNDTLIKSEINESKSKCFLPVERRENSVPGFRLEHMRTTSSGSIIRELSSPSALSESNFRTPNHQESVTDGVIRKNDMSQDQNESQGVNVSEGLKVGLFLPRLNSSLSLSGNSVNGERMGSTNNLKSIFWD
eukprot:CAMPEP_0184857052 /NCGR_PEP_ID=MMETSP0580-20130426/2222_1 /TAXON_ID=1118495 /ORGANISM="Dactyliosolen fragilissimus" /LENGTH=618 /DNA_ID=CAMNT_0027352423 /DNA_START=41 /DNA_END=1897 /DNA_ORIENTATION=+